MSNLPQVAQLTFPDSDLQTQNTAGQPVYATYDWDFDVGDFKLVDGKLVLLTGLDYLKVWIQKILRTVKGTLLYTDTSYGFEGYSLVGQNFNPAYTQSEYQRMIQDTLLQNSAITAVSGFSFSQVGSLLTISFTVDSIFGTTDGALGVPA
ncbi:hypothetical protein AAC03nite_39340 [Alicyclobacillus acidoterrestris]|nr:hypothetical protein AAC03nite_39340 [Alicyclobacillus acidoterrestris]